MPSGPMGAWAARLFSTSACSGLAVWSPSEPDDRVHRKDQLVVSGPVVVGTRAEGIFVAELRTDGKQIHEPVCHSDGPTRQRCGKSSALAFDIDQVIDRPDGHEVLPGKFDGRIVHHADRRSVALNRLAGAGQLEP